MKGLSVPTHTLTGAPGTQAGLTRSNDVVLQARQGDLFCAELDGSLRFAWTGGSSNLINIGALIVKGGVGARQLYSTGSFYRADLSTNTLDDQDWYAKASYIATDSGFIAFRSSMQWSVIGNTQSAVIQNLVLSVKQYRPSVASVPPVGAFPIGSIQEAA
jgi:hypothetical protein